MPQVYVLQSLVLGFLVADAVRMPASFRTSVDTQYLAP